MKLTTAIDLFIDDMTAYGRFNSPRTDVAYRSTLEIHAQDVDNRDPTLTGREDVKKTLRRWRNPNTQRTRRAHLVSFYQWMVREGMRPYNPAEQTHPPRKRKPEVYRLTRDEVVRMLAAARTQRERWAIHVGICAGLRRQELLGLQGRHFTRPDFIWVSSDIAKGGRERYVAVIPELAPIVQEIQAHLEPDDYMLPAQRFRDPGINRLKEDKRKHPASNQALWRLVKQVAERAEIKAPIGIHTLRHAFGDHITRAVGIEVARALLGHSDIGTTKGYAGEPTLDELSVSVQGFRFARASLSVVEHPAKLHSDLKRIEPVEWATRPVERILRDLFNSSALREAARAL